MNTNEFLISEDESFAWFRDEVSSAELAAFTHDERVFAQVRFSSLDGNSVGEIVVGPVVHLGAAVEGFSGFLRELGIIDGDLVFSARTATPGELPRRPFMVRYRNSIMPFMHPDFIVRILVTAQECLDAGEAHVPPTLKFEASYGGQKVDDRSFESYRSRGGVSLGAGADSQHEKAQALATELRGLAAVPAKEVEDELVLPAEAEPLSILAGDLTPMGELDPAEARAVSTLLARLPRLVLTPEIRVIDGSPRGIPEPEMLMKIPGAGKPYNSGIVIDWKHLPVEVIQRRLNDVQFLLDAQRRGAPYRFA